MDSENTKRLKIILADTDVFPTGELTGWLTELERFQSLNTGMTQATHLQHIPRRGKSGTLKKRIADLRKRSQETSKLLEEETETEEEEDLSALVKSMAKR